MNKSEQRQETKYNSESAEVAGGSFERKSKSKTARNENQKHYNLHKSNLESNG